MVQWLGLCSFTAKGLGSIPGWGTKIPQATWYRKKKKSPKFLSPFFYWGKSTISLCFKCLCRGIILGLHLLRICDQLYYFCSNYLLALKSFCICMHAQSFSCVQLFATSWTVVCQAPLSMGFSRQENWSEMPFPPPRDLPNPGIEPKSPEFSAVAGRFFTTEPLGKPPHPFYPNT